MNSKKVCAHKTNSLMDTFNIDLIMYIFDAEFHNAVHKSQSMGFLQCTMCPPSPIRIPCGHFLRPLESRTARHFALNDVSGSKFSRKFVVIVN